MIDYVGGPEAERAVRDVLTVARGESRRARAIAGVVLALWDSEAYRCDLAAAVALEGAVFGSVLELLAYLYTANKRLDSLVDAGAMRPIIEAWGGAFRVGLS